MIFKVWNRYTISGEHQLPPNGQGFILAANHVSYLDPPVIGSRIRRPVVFLAKEKLFSIRWLGPVIQWLGALPVAGDSDFRSLRNVIKSLKTGHAVVIFPEGTRASVDEFLDPHPGVIFLAHAAKVPIVPCYIHGTHLAWPKRARYFRPAKIHVSIGQPIHVESVDHKEKNAYYDQCAQLVMQKIKELKEQNATNGNEK